MTTFTEKNFSQILKSTRNFVVPVYAQAKEIEMFFSFDAVREIEISAKQLARKSRILPSESSPTLDIVGAKENKLLIDIRQRYFKNFEKWQLEDIYQEMQKSRMQSIKSARKQQLAREASGTIKPGHNTLAVEQFQIEKRENHRKFQYFIKYKYQVRESMKLFEQLLVKTKTKQTKFVENWNLLISFFSMLHKINQKIPERKLFQTKISFDVRFIWLAIRLSSNIEQVMGVPKGTPKNKASAVSTLSSHRESLMGVRTKRLKSRGPLQIRNMSLTRIACEPTLGFVAKTLLSTSRLLIHKIGSNSAGIQAKKLVILSFQEILKAATIRKKVDRLSENC